MAISPLDSALLAPLLSDAETADFFSDEATLRAMLDFEVALARVEEQLAVIPPGTAAAIEAAAAAWQPDWGRLGQGSAEAGHPVASLVEQLRAEAGPAGDFLHWGATAQDVVDTALTLRLQKALACFDSRLDALVQTLADRADQSRGVVMPGRTRFQQAVPITFGLKVASWMLPLDRHRRRLAELRSRVLLVQFGGAAGTLGTLGTRGVSILEGLAQELNLAAPVAPWHTQRDGVVELADWLALVTGSLAKIGQDLLLMAQTEVGEVSEGVSGVSSTMPQKANPVRSESLVAIGRMNASLLTAMQHAAVQEHERSGSSWTLEWLTLPQMVVLTGAALRHAQVLAESVAIDPVRMFGNMEASHGLLLAEAAAFALASGMPLPQSRLLVAQASRKSRASGEPLLEILERETEAEIDWEALRDPDNCLGSAANFLDRAIASVRTGSDVA